MRNASKILVRKAEGKRPLRRPRHMWENNITMDHKEMAQDRDQWWALVNVVINRWVP